jgi:ribosome-associated translation inhibitor RaiA
MERPLEIAFHGLQGTPAIEQDIRDHVDKLESHCKGLVSCRVTLEVTNGKGHPNTHLSVHIQMGLPGRDLSVSHDPHHEKDHRAHPDAHSAIRDAFKTAQRQIQDHKA